jgi:thioredoxin-dependent peroxiredoxin
MRRMGIWSSLLALLGCRSPAPLRAGQPLPDFRASAHDGSVVTPETLRGHWGVIWFFPKADTPG